MSQHLNDMLRGNYRTKPVSPLRRQDRILQVVTDEGVRTSPGASLKNILHFSRTFECQSGCHAPDIMGAGTNQLCTTIRSVLVAVTQSLSNPARQSVFVHWPVFMSDLIKRQKQSSLVLPPERTSPGQVALDRADRTKSTLCFKPCGAKLLKTAERDFFGFPCHTPAVLGFVNKPHYRVHNDILPVRTVFNCLVINRMDLRTSCSRSEQDQEQGLPRQELQ